MRATTAYSIPVFLFVFFLSFSSAFAINAYLRLYVVFSLLLVASSVLIIFWERRLTYVPDVFDVPILLLVFHLTALAAAMPNQKSLIYLLVHVYVFMVLYFSFRHAVTKVGVNKVLDFNLFAVCFVSVFVIWDHCALHQFGVDVQQFLPRFGPDPTATVALLVRRAYGFSTEPTNLAAYLVAFGGLAIYTAMRKGAAVLWSVSVLVVSALVLTFAASALGALIFGGMIIYLLLVIRSLIQGQISESVVVCSLVALIVGLTLYTLDSPLLNVVLDKLRFKDASIGSGRGTVWAGIIDLSLSNGLMPHGVGAASAQGLAVMNTYLLLLYDAGVVSVILICGYFVGVLYRVARSALDEGEKMWLMFLVISSATQMNAFSTFYYPYALLLSALVMVVARMEGRPQRSVRVR